LGGGIERLGADAALIGVNNGFPVFLETVLEVLRRLADEV
jgi:hypothetical protein